MTLKKWKIILKKMNKINVFSYWDGNKLDYIELCKETMLKYCNTDNFELHYLNYNSINDYISFDINKFYNLKFSKRIEKLKINNFFLPILVDYLRVKLLYNYGGIWIDADTIVYKEPIEIKELLNKYDIIVSTNNLKNKSRFINNGFIATNKKGKNISLYLNKINSIISKRKINKFCELSLPVITKIINDSNNSFIYDENNKKINQISHPNHKKFFYTKYDYDKLIENNNPIFVTLYNSSFPNEFKELSKKEILNKNILISEIFRKSLKIKNEK